MIEYIGDIDPYCGGKWVDATEWPYYVNVVEVIDLGSAAGADGLLLIQQYTLCDTDFDRPSISRALASWGWTTADLRGRGKAAIIAILADALTSYGYGNDPYTDVAIVGNYGPGSDKATWQGWQDLVNVRATVRLYKDYGGDLDNFIREEYLW